MSGPDPSIAPAALNPEDAAAKPFRLADFAASSTPEAKPTAGAAARAPVEPTREPYSDQEIAELVGNLSAFGLPVESLGAYERAFVARSAPILGLLQAGEALADLGIHKGAGVGVAPAWLRATAAGVGLAVVVVMTRRQFAAEKGGGGDDWTANAGPVAPGGEGDVSGE